MDDWYLYLVRTRLGTLYTGISTDVPRRLSEHEENEKGAKYLRSKGPLELAYAVRIGDRALALRAEHVLKQLPKADKEKIVRRRPAPANLLELLGVASSNRTA